MTAILLIVPLIAAAPVPKDLKAEAPPLAGAWKLTAITIGGRAAGGNLDAVWRFDGDSYTVEHPVGSTSVARAFKTDPKASPARFEFGTEGTQLGVYEVKGDALAIAIGVSPGTRPAKVTAPDAIVYSFTRVK